MSNSFRNRRSTSCQEENSSKSTCTGHVVLVFELMPKRMCYCSPVGVNENVQSSKGSSPFLPVSYPRDSTGNTHTQTYTVGQGISTSNAKEKSDPMYLVITTTSQKRHQLCVHSFEGRDARARKRTTGFCWALAKGELWSGDQEVSDPLLSWPGVARSWKTAQKTLRTLLMIDHHVNDWSSSFSSNKLQKWVVETLLPRASLDFYFFFKGEGRSWVCSPFIEITHLWLFPPCFIQHEGEKFLVAGKCMSLLSELCKMRF